MANKKFKKPKSEQASRQKEEQLFSVSYQSPFNNFNTRAFPVLKVVLIIVTLFSAALLFLFFGADTIKTADHVLASYGGNNQSSGIAPQQAVVKTPPEIKISGRNIPAPAFDGNAVIAQDFDSGTILYQKNIASRLAPASTTKLMTALTAIGYYKAADILVVPAGAMVGGSVMDLGTGDKFTFRSLLYGMLLDSGNDAAYTIALDYPGGMTAFMDKMNQKAAEMGLESTHFTNPAGFDDPDHYSSASDLAKIARAAASDYQLARIVATKDTQIETYDGEVATAGASLPHVYNLHNLNQLLKEPGVLGMKTGTTEKAGENLVGLVERNGHKVITVMLGSRDRFNQTKKLMDWVYANYSWE